MSAKPAKRNWNDVQIAIATAGIVTTLGMWNLFATPAKVANAQTPDPTLPPPTDPPTETEAPVASSPTSLPYVKIIFTPGAPPPTTVAPQVQVQPQPAPKKKHKSNGGGGSSAPAAQTKSS